jgi:hypothetical protein
MVVHHSGVHEDRRERGSNVLRGAADTIIKVSRKGDKIDLINNEPQGKQKDFDEFPIVKLEARQTSYVTIDGDEVNTIVLNERADDDDADQEETDDSDSGGAGGGKAPRGDVQFKLYEVIRNAHAEAPGLAMDKATLIARSGVKEGSFAKAIGALVAAGLIDRHRDITSNAFVWRMAGT